MNKRLIALSVSIRLYLQLVAAVAARLLPFKASFPYWESVLQPQAPAWLWYWGNFDGVHYLNIAKVGYEYGLTQAFFPVYPLLIRFFSYFWGQPLVTALVISHLCFIGFIYFFIKLGRYDFSRSGVNWALILLLLFPTSFFFFGVYTESLFLILAAASFYYARRQQWGLAALLAGLASGTRLVGIFLLPALMWEYFQLKKRPDWLKIIGLGAVCLSGFLAYLLYLAQKFQNFLIFIDSQPGFGAGRQVDKIILPYQVIARYLRMLFTVDRGNDIYFVLVFEFAVGLAVMALLIWAYIKKIRMSYLFFMVPALLLPTLTGSFASMPRYALVGFPLFYLLGNIRNFYLKLFLAAVFMLLLTWALGRFSRGYWLA